MGFSNKKEDVIYMELTPYGRQLLSRGELMPAYYSFFDDDVLYDIGLISTSDTSNYPSGFLSESVGQAKERILNSTPYLKPQICFSGRDQKIVSIQNYYLYNNLYEQESDEKVNFLNYPIGTSDYHSKNFTPYWDIKYLHGTASATEVSTGVFSLNTKKILDSSNPQSSSLPFRNIPQVEFALDYKLSIKNIYSDEEGTDQLEFVSPNLQISNVADDGSYVSMKEQTLMLHIIEENAFQNGKSFSVEVFKKDKFKDHKYIPLKFSSEIYENMAQRVVDDMLVENLDSFADPDFNDPDLLAENDPSFVEYFFDLRLDSEIPEDDICQGLKFLKRKEIYIDIDLDCIDRDDIADIDIYATKVTEIEEC